MFAGERDSRAQRLLFVAQRAYEQRADDHYAHVPPVDVATGSNSALWARQPGRPTSGLAADVAVDWAYARTVLQTRSWFYAYRPGLPRRSA